MSLGDRDYYKKEPLISVQSRHFTQTRFLMRGRLLFLKTLLYKCESIFVV